MNGDLFVLNPLIENLITANSVKKHTKYSFVHYVIKKFVLLIICCRYYTYIHAATNLSGSDNC